MTVTPNFSGVTSLTVHDYAGSTCSFDWWQVTFAAPLPLIINRSVNGAWAPSPGNSLNGTFENRSGQGTVSLYQVFPRCTTGILNWTATTDATPPWAQPPPRPPAQVRCRVPNVIGQRLAAARSRIKARNCRVGNVRRKRSRRVGRVIQQSPRGGAVRARNFRVNLTVGRR